MFVCQKTFLKVDCDANRIKLAEICTRYSNDMRGIVWTNSGIYSFLPDKLVSERLRIYRDLQNSPTIDEPLESHYIFWDETELLLDEHEIKLLFD